MTKAEFTRQLNLNEFIDIKHYGGFLRLKCMLFWVLRFFNYFKQKILKRQMLLKEIHDKKELHHSEEVLILNNRK